MSHDDQSGVTDPRQPPDSRPDPTEGPGTAGWLDELNSFLERAIKADLDTGC